VSVITSNNSELTGWVYRIHRWSSILLLVVMWVMAVNSERGGCGAQRYAIVAGRPATE
jgi:hypothetical protein